MRKYNLIEQEKNNVQQSNMKKERRTEEVIQEHGKYINQDRPVFSVHACMFSTPIKR